MKVLALSVCALGLLSAAAVAAPTQLTKAQLDQVVAGAITEQRTNPAGHDTQGQGQAITVTNVNPAGHAPGGQNK